MESRFWISVVAFTFTYASTGCFPSLPPDTDDTTVSADGLAIDDTTNFDVAPDAAIDETDAISVSLTPPAAVSASSEFEDRIVVTWMPVEGATGYNVYRDGSVLARIE